MKMNLHEQLIDICGRAQLRKIPKLTVRKGTDAHTRINKIRIGHKLALYLNEGEMEGVIAHEVCHADNFLKQILISVPTGIFIMIAVFAVELLGFLVLVREYPMLVANVPIAAFQAILSAPIVLSFLAFQRFMSKKRELWADRFAASIVGSRTFAGALRKVYSIQSKRSMRSRIWAWFNPHPPLSKRLRAIRNIKRRPHPAGGNPLPEGKAAWKYTHIYQRQR